MMKKIIVLYIQEIKQRKQRKETTKKADKIKTCILYQAKKETS
jgi:hypothetical protein